MCTVVLVGLQFWKEIDTCLYLLQRCFTHDSCGFLFKYVTIAVFTVTTEKKDTQEEVEGSVDETLPNALFRVTVDDTQIGQVLAYLSGRMRMNRIKVLVGDRVSLVLDPHGGRARITKRL